MVHFIQHIFHIFLNWSGSSNPSGNQYGFWSGFGSDIGELAILGGVIQIFRHQNCAVKGCYRIGKHAVDGTGQKTCHKHAVKQIHDKLKAEHKKNFPLQHKLLNKEK